MNKIKRKSIKHKKCVRFFFTHGRDHYDDPAKGITLFFFFVFAWRRKWRLARGKINGMSVCALLVFFPFWLCDLRLVLFFFFL